MSEQINKYEETRNQISEVLSGPSELADSFISGMSQLVAAQEAFRIQEQELAKGVALYAFGLVQVGVALHLPVIERRAGFYMDELLIGNPEEIARITIPDDEYQEGDVYSISVDGETINIWDLLQPGFFSEVEATFATSTETRPLNITAINLGQEVSSALRDIVRQNSGEV